MANNLKNVLKNNDLVMWLYRRFFEGLTIISPKLNTKVHYRLAFGKKLDLNNPITLNEKICKLKLDKYGKEPIYKKCADKFAVRDYVISKGCESILVPLLFSYDNVDEIEWEKLPDAFAMKWNFGCDYNIICPNKEALNIEDSIKKMKRWGKKKTYLSYAEMQYKDVTKKIIVEQYLKPKTGILPEDYKVYCFHGEPMFIMVCSNRESGSTKFYYLSPEWELKREMSNDGMNASKDLHIPRPDCLNELLKYARILSADFDFVRAYFYIVDNKVYFGELTFSPMGGMDSGRRKEADLIMGDLLHV